MLKNYLKHSGLWVGLVFNPYHWEIRFDLLTDELNPNTKGFYISVGVIWIRGVIDDGSW
jgi:hypothetical protein